MHRGPATPVRFTFPLRRLMTRHKMASTSSCSISDRQNTRYAFSVDSSCGVGSLRQCAGFPASVLDDQDDSSYFAPLGASVVRWDIISGQRISDFQAHSDLVTCMLYNQRAEIILTASYSGEIKLWSRSWELSFSDQAVFPGIYFAAWSELGDRFLLCGGGKDSHIAVYSVTKDKEKLEVALSWELRGKHTAVDHCKQDQATDDEPSSSTYIQQKDGYDAAVFTPRNQVLAVLQRYNYQFSEVHLISESGGIVKSRILDPLGNTQAAILCMTPCHNGTFAVGFQGGIFLLLEEESLSVRSVLQALGSPQIALWHGENLLAVSYLSGILSWWTVDGSLVHELKGGPTDSIIKLDWASPSCKALWIGGIMSLHYVTFNYNDNPSGEFPHKLKEQHKLAFHEVTGCGVAMNNQNLVASGDFTGNVFVWEKGKTNPMFKTKYESSIRCLSWNSVYVFIGSLDGNLLQWNPESLHSSPQVILTCIGGILAMSWSHDNCKLLIGLDTGHLCAYSFTQNFSNCAELLNFRAHSSTRDGYLVGMEIWSVCWSPCDRMMATASEDQTACVWKSSSGKKLQTITGHTTAVTSIDWKVMSSGENIIATCADDRTVQIIDGCSFKVLRVLQTGDIAGWYTLTYLGLNPVKQWCLCSTQNGHLLLWDCLTGDQLVCRKMHGGSIEGLVWNKDFTLCATCSSDCVVGTYRVVASKL